MPKRFFSKHPSLRLADGLLKEHLLWLFFLRVIFISLFLGLSILLQPSSRTLIIPPLNYIAYFIAGVYLYTILSALILKKIKKTVTFAHSQVLIDTLLVTLLIYSSGGSQSIFIPVYFFPIIAGSIILLRHGGLATAAASTLGYGVVLLLEYLGHYPDFFTTYAYRPPRDIMVVLNYFSIHGLSFFLAAFLSALLSEQLRKTEKALNLTSRRFDRLNLLYKQIFDDIATGIITLDEDDAIGSFNRASEKITGFSGAEVLGRSLADIFPQLRGLARAATRPATELIRKDGSKIQVAYSCSKLNMPENCEACQVITLQDLSEIKKMEKQVQQAEKMAAIGEMAAGVAHEFRNPLAAISGSAEVLRQEIEQGSSGQRLLEIIIRECNRQEESISDFLLFSKPGRPEREWVPLDSLVRDVTMLLRQSKNWEDRFQTMVNIPPQLDCWADPQQLTQVMINLLGNSCQAMAGQGDTIRIDAEEFTTEDGQTRTRIRINDNGPGIAPDNLGKIFEPFFTTREKGTGLGLAIVRQIIASHNGAIKAQSRPGQDTTFEIVLPCPET